MNHTEHLTSQSEWADVAAVRLRDAIGRLCADVAHRDPDRSGRRLIAAWWRSTRAFGPTRASAVALAAGLAELAPHVGANPRWTQIQALAAEAVDAQGPRRTEAVEAVLVALGIDPVGTTWDEAIADWADMADECGAMTPTECAGHLGVHLRYALGIARDGDTPAADRERLVDAMLAGLASVARTKAGWAGPVWAGLTHADVVLPGQDPLARCAGLIAVLDELDVLSGGG